MTLLLKFISKENKTIIKKLQLKIEAFLVFISHWIYNVL